MNIVKALQVAGVPEKHYKAATASIELASKRAEGLLLHKMNVRYLKAKKISKILQWEDERLCVKYPKYAEYDIAPMKNITCNGDHLPWKNTPEGGRPDPDAWMNKDTNSLEYQEAVMNETSLRYFNGNHPRSRKAREMWYRRNGGEYAAWERGQVIRPSEGFERWTGTQGSTQVIVTHADGAWIIRMSEKHGPFRVNSRIGFEVDNVYCGTHSPQAWFPIDGYELRGCATHSVMLGKELKLAPPMWGINFVEPTERGTYLCWPHNR